MLRYLYLSQVCEFITQFPNNNAHISHTDFTTTDPHPIFLSTALIILDRVMYIKSATSPLIHITTSWSIVLLHAPTVAAAEMAKFSMFDCGSTRMSQPLVQQFNLNIPDECSNASTVYHPPQIDQTVQVLQIPSFSPITVHNCLIAITVSVGYCGNSGFSHTVSQKVIFPSSLECLHAVNKGVMKFTFPVFGTAKRTRLSVPLTKGQASFEEYLVGYSTISSDCRGKPFTSSDGTYVAKAIVRLEGSITVRTNEAKLIKNRSILVITDKIQFHRSSIANHVNEPVGDSVAAHLYAMSKNELEVYRDVTEGLFVTNKSSIPIDTCQTAQTVWSSTNVTIHHAMHPQTPDIIEVSEGPNSVHLSIILKLPSIGFG